MIAVMTRQSKETIMAKRRKWLIIPIVAGLSLFSAVPAAVNPPGAEALGFVYHTCGAHNDTLVGESDKYRAKTYTYIYLGCGRVSAQGWYYTHPGSPPYYTAVVWDNQSAVASGGGLRGGIHHADEYGNFNT